MVYSCKKLLFFIITGIGLFTLLFSAKNAHGQTAFNCAYTESTEIRPYQSIGVTGNGSFAWSPASLWDNASSGNSIFFTGGVNFNFNGNIYSTCGYSANGYIWFGSGPVPGAGTPDVLSVPSLGANNFGVIAGFACDLYQHPSLSAFPVPPNGGFGPRLIQYNTFGSSPNRYVAIEFIGFYPKVNGCGGAPDHHRVDFQIRLYENNPAGTHPNRIEIHHRDQSAFCNDRPYSFQVGIRGANPQDFLCRKQDSGNLTANSSSPGTANTDRINFLAGDHVATGGLVFIYDYNVKPQIFPNPIAVNNCPSTSVLLTSSIQSNIRWYRDNVPLQGPEATAQTYSATVTGSYKVVIEDPLCPRSSDPVDVTILPCGTQPPVIQTDPSGRTACSGQQITLSVSASGTPLLQYRWRKNGVEIPGANQSQLVIPAAGFADAGNYDVIVSNSGGADTSQIAVIALHPQVSTQVSVAAPGFSDLCNGPVQLQTETGLTDITWSDGSTGVTSITVSAQGNYSLTAKDPNGCQVVSNSITITNSPPPQIEVNPPGPVFLCNGQVNLNGPVGFSNYMWSDGSNEISLKVSIPGTYTLEATAANGCRGKSAPVEVRNANTGTLKISYDDSVICTGSQISLSATPGFSGYSWSNGENGQNIQINGGGSYWVSAVDASGCLTKSDTVEIGEEKKPIAEFSYNQGNGYTIFFENTSSNGRSWIWDFGNGAGSNLTNPSHTFPFDDTYPVKLIAINSCGSDTLLINVLVKKLVGIEDPEGGWFDILPNPSQTELFIRIKKYQTKNISISLFSEGGQLIWKFEGMIHADLVEVPQWINLDAGIYLVRVNTDDGQQVKKIIKS
jgi:PKD repeat protein